MRDYLRSSGLLLTAALLAPTLARAGTVAYYRFDNDTVAGASKDETGVNNGSILGGAPYVSSVGQNPVKQTGAANATSLGLNGTNQYVSVPNNSSLSFGSSAWTIEAYINLNTLPTPATAGQWIAQKKDAAADDFQDYGFLVGGNRAGLFGTYGKSTGVTGHELVVELGKGAGWTTITSTLEVPAAAQWVFVSAAYDGGTSLRFTLDSNLTDNLPGLIETIPLPGLTNVTNNGPLTLGAKRNAAGAAAQLFGGSIDEIRVSNGVVPVGELLSSTAVPEPSTIVLAGLAALACFAIRRRAKA
jgi:hypothetical protein